MNRLFLPQQLLRKKAEKELEDNAKLPLTVVVAPMGYGKTTLVKNFVEHLPDTSVFWLSFEQNEFDDDWIWYRLCALITEKDAKLGCQLSDIKLPKNRKEMEFFFKIIKNTIKRQTYIVIDDYQEGESSNLNRIFESLAYLGIQNLHVILISRTYPDFPCYELWMKGYCALVEQDIFILSKEEIKEFFYLNEISLSEEEIQEIYMVSDGWVAAIYLGLINYMRYHTFHNMDNILHLLKESIYDKLSWEQKIFLMKLSILDTFTAQQAEYLLESPIDITTIMNLLEQTGFVKYEAGFKTYQMHILLKETARLELGKSEIDIKRLFFLCARWYQEKKDYIHAILYYEKAEKQEEIWQLLEEQYCNNLYAMAPAIFKRFFESYNLEIKMKYIKAYFSYIYYLLVGEASRGGEFLFHEAVSYWEAQPGGKECRERGELYLIESLFCFNHLSSMKDCVIKAKQCLKGQKSIFLGSIDFITFCAPEMILLYHSIPGKLQEVREAEKEYANSFALLDGNGVRNEWNEFIDAEYYHIIGEIEKANQFARIACEKARFHKKKNIVINCYYILMESDLIYGRTKDFSYKMEQLEREMKTEGDKNVLTEYDLVLGHLFALIGRIDKIAEWIKNFDLNDCNAVIRSARSSCIVYGVILMEHKQWEKLEGISVEMQRLYQNAYHVKVHIIAYIYRAIASYHLYGIEKALEYFNEALALAEPDNLVIPFMRSYIFMEPILKEAMKASKFAKYLFPMCEMFKEGRNKFQSLGTGTSFTNREQEILTLLPEGYTNAEIGRKLHIATVTVEKNLKNIYHKLGVSNRMEAILKFGGRVR